MNGCSRTHLPPKAGRVYASAWQSWLRFAASDNEDDSTVENNTYMYPSKRRYCFTTKEEKGQCVLQIQYFHASVALYTVYTVTFRSPLEEAEVPASKTKQKAASS